MNRIPYVGEGADGARRSAQIDREEADGLDYLDPRRGDLLASAALWEEQARLLDPPHADRDGSEPPFSKLLRDGGSPAPGSWAAAERALDRIEDTCCGNCPGSSCYVDGVTGA